MDTKYVYDFNRPLEMQTLKTYGVPKTIAACTMNNRHPMEALKKTQYKYAFKKKPFICLLSCYFILFPSQQVNC